MPGADPVTAASDPTEELPLLGERPAVELANSLYLTGDEEVDFLDTPDACGLWTEGLCAAEGWTPPTTAFGELAVAALQQLREAVRALMMAAVDGTVPEQQAVAIVNLQATEGADRPALRWSRRDGPRLELVGGLPDPGALRGRLARDAIDLLAGDDRIRLRRCANPPCPMLFVAGHGRRRFCHPGCSHVVRQQRYRRRAAAPGT